MVRDLDEIFISLHYVINSEAKLYEKNEISKYM